jgi:quinol-cytochrome oxidoreductase complex cytochrome b subunit
MSDVLAMCIGVVIGMGAGFITVAYVAPRVFDWIIKKGIGS